MHICVSKLTIIGSDNGLSPGWRQAIIRTSAGILLMGPLEINFSEIVIRIQTFPFKKMHLKMAYAKWRPFCLSLNVLINNILHSCITVIMMWHTVKQSSHKSDGQAMKSKCFCFYKKQARWCINGLLPGLGSIPELELELIPIPIPIPGIGIAKELNKRNWNWNWNW